MAKVKHKSSNTFQPKTPVIVMLDAYIKSISTPRNIGNLTGAFLILVMFLTIPLLVIATINQRDLRSTAQVPICPPIALLNDQTPPSVSIQNPSEGNYLTGKGIMIKIGATDNTCVQKVSLLIDGKLVKTFDSTPYIYYWDLRAVTAGSHVISVRAADASSNISVASASVFRSAKSFVKF